MSTCDRTCQLGICPNEGNDLEARLATIFGVLDVFNGLLGILVAIFIGYIQVRQLRQLHRHQPIIDEPEGGVRGVPALRLPVGQLIKATETAARADTFANHAASQLPHDGETSNGDENNYDPPTADQRRV